MRRRIRTVLLTTVVISMLGVLAVMLFAYGGTASRTSLPHPNGYDDFLKAHSKITGDVGGYSNLSFEELRHLVSTNAESLRLLRLGFTRTCSVPTAAAMTNIPAMMTDLPRFKALAHLLAAEGRLAEFENRPGDAARSYVDCIHLGNEISRGGFVINRLVGVSCGAIGGNPLARLAPILSCEQARPIIAELEKINGSWVTWDEVSQNENMLMSHELRKDPNPLKWAVAWWGSGPAKKRAETRHNILLAHLRLFPAELALRCSQAEHGHPPLALQQLVPKYLHAVPIDPFSGQPIVYRASGTNWLLYSVGMDRLDNGGKPVGRGPESKGDIFFDSPW